MINTESGVHVIASAGGWSVQANGDVFSNHRSRSVAIDTARRLAKRRGSTYTLHSKTGETLSTKSYEIKPL